MIYDSVGSIHTPKEYFERLREAGVAVCEFNPVTRRPDKVNNRDHRKILVVDGRVAFTGGINISETYASSSRRARAAPIRSRPRGTAGATRTSRSRGRWWRSSSASSSTTGRCRTAAPGPRRASFPPPEPRGDDGDARRAHRSRRDASEMYRRAARGASARAKSRVWLTFGYFVPDPQTKQALLDAARRGVDVQLVLPGFSDFWAPVYAGRSHYEELLDAGVRIYEWREALMHAKTAVIDSVWSSVGSTNLDWRSFVHNYEADLIVHDAGFARELERRFRLDVAAAHAGRPRSIPAPAGRARG